MSMLCCCGQAGKLLSSPSTDNGGTSTGAPDGEFDGSGAKGGLKEAGRVRRHDDDEGDVRPRSCLPAVGSSVELVAPQRVEDGDVAPPRDGSDGGG